MLDRYPNMDIDTGTLCFEYPYTFILVLDIHTNILLTDIRTLDI